MARILIATVPLTGHVQPMKAIATALVGRGHEVWWTTGQKFSRAVTATGARFVASVAARDWDDANTAAAFPELAKKSGLARVKAQVQAMFIAPIDGQVRDMQALAREGAPAAVVSDSGHLGAGIFCELTGVPWAQVGISALMFPSADTMPFGSARRPVGQPRVHRFVNWLIFRVVFAALNRAYRAARVACGLPAGTQSYFEVISPQLFLQPTVAELEYPRSDLPPQVRFIGPLLPAVAASARPAFWSDIQAAVQAGRPVLLVTQGTLAIDPRELILPTLAALADLDVLVVATTGQALPPSLANRVPANARVADFIPYQQLLPEVACMITNGGYGGVQMALAHGVPLVLAGASEEKPEIAERVAWAGAGLRVKPRGFARTGRRVRAAVQTILAQPEIRARAQAIAARMAEHDAPARAVELIEGLLG